MAKRYYLAYGSNLNVGQMRMRCPAAEIVGTAEIKDYELLYKGSATGAYLTIEKRKGGAVPVGVWAVDAHDEEALDRYEGCPVFYYKTEMELPVKYTSSGRVIKRRCFIYIMHEERKPGMPSKQYVKVCQRGYRYFGFDEEILADAERLTMGILLVRYLKNKGYLKERCKMKLAANGEKICPKCGKKYTGQPALSREDNITSVCPECGVREAMVVLKETLIYSC